MRFNGLLTLGTFVSEIIGDSNTIDIHGTVTLGGVTVLNLATLGGTTRNRNNPICVTSSEVAKAVTKVTVTCHCRRRYRSKLR